ncbi:MAG: type II secretion system protein [Clostridia bacterium]|nr:type II secretion system protein [Clostridia bacterium]
MFKKFHSGNKGFSLVELLVAIVILGIASSAVIHAFVTASRITSQAKAFGEATGAADNIAEAVDAFSKDGFLSGAFADMLGVSVEEESNQVFKQDDSTLAIKNLTSGNAEYDAVVTYSEGDPDGELESDDYGIYELNNYEIAQYTAMDGSFTQSWQDAQNPDYLADVAFWDEALSNHASQIVDSVPKYRAKNRLISVNVYTDSTNKIYMDVIYNYTYVYNYNEYVQGVPTGTVLTGTYVYTWQSAVTFNQGDPSKYDPSEGNAEPTVFIMYYPDYAAKLYSSFERKSFYEIDDERTNMTDSYYDLADYSDINYNTSYGNYKGKDLIVINNLGNVPTKFFIVKQRKVDAAGIPCSNSAIQMVPHPTTGGTMPGETATSRACIVERLTDTALLTNKKANMVYTNAGVNLINDELFNNFTGYKIVGASGTTITAYKNTQGEIDYLKKDLVSTGTDPRYFKVTVDVYPAGSVDTAQVAGGPENPDEEVLYSISTEGASPIYSFVGSKLE